MNMEENDTNSNEETSKQEIQSIQVEDNNKVILDLNWNCT